MKTATPLATLALTSLLLAASPVHAQKLARHWTGTAVVTNNGNDILTKVPVSLDLSTAGGNGVVSGTFLNGDERSPSSSGSLTGGHLVLQFNAFARKLEGDIQGSSFHGTFGGARLKKPYTVDLHVDGDGKAATRFVPAARTQAAQKGADINGHWEIAVGTSDKSGEKAWGLDVSPFKGSGEVQAVIQRIDGDSGSLFGRFDEATGAYHVSRFGDFGATAYTLKPNADGTLLVSNDRDPKESNTARRPDDARKEKLSPPAIATEHTTMENPLEPLQFSGPNLTGETIRSTDAQFKGKVVIVAIGGSWCPNCHDEAPLLVDLYNRFHARGLEVVDLSFEEDDQLKNPERLRAFITRYHIPYTVLLMGTPDDLNAKLPQAKNLDSWPTSFFIGRDGLVKGVHAGFSGPATGAEHTRLVAETTAMVEKLLAANEKAQR